ncbi:hypothetical protein [Pusillimonas minor]|uniref:Uncharacterized protein n=1 Tax=Pusillimonas minor TaxID=2697024 RepID=A0A842HRI9_9BURK|nr:hypothetical protein [Pusillimonas minor]MBC2769465.1 hypothetical protein [Pusillimonas minor]
MTLRSGKKKPVKPQKDDTTREQQTSHRSEQHRSKKEGHTSQIGSGHDQQSERQGTHDPLHRKP